MWAQERNANGECGSLQNGELHSLYRSPNIISVIKCRRLRWAGHVDRMEEGNSAFQMLTGKPTGRGLQGGLGVDGRTILEWTLKRQVSMRIIGLIRLRIKKLLESPCECRIEPPGLISRGVSQRIYTVLTSGIVSVGSQMRKNCVCFLRSRGRSENFIKARFIKLNTIFFVLYSESNFREEGTGQGA